MAWSSHCHNEGARANWPEQWHLLVGPRHCALERWEAVDTSSQHSSTEALRPDTLWECPCAPLQARAHHRHSSRTTSPRTSENQRRVEGASGNRGLHYVWTGTTTFVVDADRISEPYEPGTPMDSEQDDNGEEPEEPVDYDELPDEAPMGPPPPPTTTTSSSAKPSSSPHVHPATTAPADAELPEQSPTTQSVMEPEPLEEPQVPPSLTTSHLPIPEGQKPFFVPENKETFAQQRARVARQETLLIRRPESYGPATAQPVRETPYSQKPLNDDDKIEFTCEVDLMPNSHLPPGWNYENGYMVLGEIEDEWRIEGNYLTSGPGEGVHSNRGQLSCSFEVFGTPTHHQVGQWTSSPRQMDPWYALQTADRTRLDWLHTVQDPNTTPKGCQEHLPGQELWRWNHLPAGGQDQRSLERKDYVFVGPTCLQGGQAEGVSFVLPERRLGLRWGGQCQTWPHPAGKVHPQLEDQCWWEPSSKSEAHMSRVQRPGCFERDFDYSEPYVDSSFQELCAEHCINAGLLPLHGRHLDRLPSGQELWPWFWTRDLGEASPWSWWSTWSTSWTRPSDEAHQAHVRPGGCPESLVWWSCGKDFEDGRWSHSAAPVGQLPLPGLRPADPTSTRWWWCCRSTPPFGDLWTSCGRPLGMLWWTRPCNQSPHGQAEIYFQFSRMAQWCWEGGAHLLRGKDHQDRRQPLEDPPHWLPGKAETNQLSKRKTTESFACDWRRKNCASRPTWWATMASHSDCSMAPGPSEYDGWISDHRYYNHSLGSKQSPTVRQTEWRCGLGISKPWEKGGRDLHSVFGRKLRLPCRQFQPRWLHSSHGGSSHCWRSWRPLQLGGLAQLEAGTDLKIHFGGRISSSIWSCGQPAVHLHLLESDLEALVGPQRPADAEDASGTGTHRGREGPLRFAGEAWSSGKQWYRQTYHHRSFGDTGQIGLLLSEDPLGIIRTAICWWTHQTDGRSTIGRTTSNSHGEAQERHYVPGCEEEDASRKTKKHKDVCNEEASASSTSDVCYVLDRQFSDLLGHHRQHNLHLQQPLPGHAQAALHRDSGDCHRHHGAWRLEDLEPSWSSWTGCWRRNPQRGEYTSSLFGGNTDRDECVGDRDPPRTLWGGETIGNHNGGGHGPQVRARIHDGNTPSGIGHLLHGPERSTTCSRATTSGRPPQPDSSTRVFHEEWSLLACWSFMPEAICHPGNHREELLHQMLASAWWHFAAGQLGWRLSRDFFTLSDFFILHTSTDVNCVLRNGDFFLCFRFGISHCLSHTALSTQYHFKGARSCLGLPWATGPSYAF